MIFIKSVYAQCPVCIITVGGGLFIAKKLGIDNLLASIWFSALNTAFALWFASLMKKKLLKRSLIWSVGLYLISFWYLSFTNQIGHPGNTFLGMDKIIFGMTIGFILIYLSAFLDRVIRYRNHGKVVVPYQKVIIPVVILLLMTGVFTYLLK